VGVVTDPLLPKVDFLQHSWYPVVSRVRQYE
jgi:hypothetical protein